MPIEKQGKRVAARSGSVSGNGRPSTAVPTGTDAPDARSMSAGGCSCWTGTEGRQANVTEMLESVNGTVPSPIVAYLESLLERHTSDRRGVVATYIPELAGTDPDLFASAS